MRAALTGALRAADFAPIILKAAWPTPFYQGFVSFENLPLPGGRQAAREAIERLRQVPAGL